MSEPVVDYSYDSEDSYSGSITSSDYSDSSADDFQLQFQLPKPVVVPTNTQLRSPTPK